jgi:hypothetical protein
MEVNVTIDREWNAPSPRTLNFQERGFVLFVWKQSALVACMQVTQSTLDDVSCFVSRSPDWKLNMQQVTQFRNVYFKPAGWRLSIIVA